LSVPVDASASLERIRAYVHRHLERLDTPGLALAVTDRERSLGGVVAGYADLAAREPVAAHHRFQIGSISKGFTALAILGQVEEGRIDLDAPVTAYLPWFEVRTAFGPITVHHLLSHTSGIVTGTDFTG
jgi:CubicO group peptidase (beta-lactamase class C family)